VIEFYPSRDAADREFAEILADGPGWVEKLEIVLVDRGGGRESSNPLSHRASPSTRDRARGRL